jgi:hypothetical protein
MAGELQRRSDGYDAHLGLGDGSFNDHVSAPLLYNSEQCRQTLCPYLRGEVKWEEVVCGLPFAVLYLYVFLPCWEDDKQHLVLSYVAQYRARHKTDLHFCAS